MTDVADDQIPSDSTGWVSPFALTGSTWLCHLLIADTLPDASWLEDIDAGDLADIDPVEVVVARLTTPEGKHETTPGPADFGSLEDVTITGWVYTFLTPGAAWTAQSEALSLPGRIMRMVLLTEPYEITDAETIIIDSPDPITVEYVPTELVAP